MDDTNDINIKIDAKLGILSRPDGSVLLNQGDSTVIAGVYGPVEIKYQDISIEKATVKAHYRPKAGLPGVGDRLYEAIVRNICETSIVAALYPRSGIIVIIQEMENGGGLIASAINAACLALIDSGIDMKFLIAAVSCVLDSDDNLLVEPNIEQHSSAKGTFVFVFESCQKCIVASHTTGTFSVEHYESAIQLCRRATENVFDFYKNVIQRSCIKQ